MAMNIHQEARRRQMHMDRVCEARRKMAVAQGDEVGTYVAGQPKADEVMCTDQGQFHQTRQFVDSGVVFEKVVHDPNFYYRSSVERGLEPPLHVNEIYKIMYPRATQAVPRSSQKK